MIHAALWIISTFFVIWFSFICGALILAFVVTAWRWILGFILLVGVLIFVNVNTKKEPLPPPISNPSVETAKAISGRIVSAKEDSKLYEPLAASVQAAMNAAIAERAAPEPLFTTPQEKIDWLTEMSLRLARRLPDREARLEFLKTEYYEAKRAGLDPQMVLALIDTVSSFQKYAVSSFGARGYMQVMPVWVQLIGSKESDLFHLRTNLRFGCTILRHYLDIENGDLFRALIRYRQDMEGKGVVAITEQDAKFADSVRKLWESQWSWKPVPSNFKQQVSASLPEATGNTDSNDQSEKFVVEVGGYCNETNDCVRGLVCTSHMCLKPGDMKTEPTR